MDDKIESLKKILDIIYKLEETLRLEEEAADLETLSEISEKLAVGNHSTDEKTVLINQQEALKKKIEERREIYKSSKGIHEIESNPEEVKTLKAEIAKIQSKLGLPEK